MKKELNNFNKKERGISLIGLILVFALVGLVMIVVAQITPTVIEFVTIKKAIQTAKNTGKSVQEIRTSFEKQADVGYVTSISGHDLIIESINGEFEVSFAYSRKIHIFGPGSILLEYEGTTAKAESKVKKIE